MKFPADAGHMHPFAIRFAEVGYLIFDLRTRQAIAGARLFILACGTVDALMAQEKH